MSSFFRPGISDYDNDDDRGYDDDDDRGYDDDDDDE